MTSSSQSAFVTRCQICDNVLLAIGCNHFLKNMKIGKEHFAILRLDMSKANDRVEWSFVELTLSTLGIHESFISFVMLCITIVSFSFILNGKQLGFVQPESEFGKEIHFLPTYSLFVLKVVFSPNVALDVWKEITTILNM
ncbi:UNVERIFIED_CONTAM: hypothetical protein Sindi_2592900 [Sesamum indicum]